MKAFVIGLALAVVGGLLCIRISSPLRAHTSLLLRDLGGGQPWERSTQKQIIAPIILSQLKGSGAGRHWVHFVEGFHHLGANTPAERVESFGQIAGAIPEQTEEWLPSGGDLSKSYLYFLSAVKQDSEMRRTITESELRGWQAAQEIFGINGLETQTHSRDRRWGEIRDAALVWFRRSPTLTASALSAVKILEAGPGFRDAFSTEPQHDVEIKDNQLGQTIYTSSVGSCDGKVNALGETGAESIDGVVETTLEVREFTIKRPWMDESLLDRYANSPSIAGQRFFGEGGSLHLIASHVIVLSEPYYVVRTNRQNEAKVRGLIEAGRCCSFTCGNVTKSGEPNSAVLSSGRLVARDALLRPEVFAVVSRVRP